MKTTRKTRSTLLLLAIISLTLGGCGRSAQSDNAPMYSTHPQRGATLPEYSFGIFPLHSAVGLSEVYQPLMDAINRQVSGFTVRMEAARDHPTYEAKLRERQFDLAMMAQFQAVAAEGMGYRIFGRIGGTEARGIIFVRKDSGIKTVNDLRGKAISFSSPTAIATLMCKVALLKAGLNVETDAKPVYVGTLDSAVMNVYSGLTAAGCVWPPTLQELKRQRPEIVDALEVKWRATPVGNVAFAARSDMPEAHRNAIAKVLFDLDKTEQGRLLLARMDIPRIEPANSKTYDPVRKFLEEYKRLFGKLPEMEGPKK